MSEATIACRGLRKRFGQAVALEADMELTRGAAEFRAAVAGEAAR